MPQGTGTMIALTFLPRWRDGRHRGGPGETLLRAGQRAGNRGGHLWRTNGLRDLSRPDDPAFLDRLPAPSAEEEDMLDLVPDATRSSRLACQIALTPALDGLIARLP